MKLGVDHVAVRHHQHGVKHLAVLGVVQLGQKVCGPGNRVGLAGTGAVLNQVLATRAVGQHGDLQLARHVQLVVTGKDDLRYLLFLVALGDQVAAQYFKPALARPDLFPQVGGAVTIGGVHRIASSAIVTQVERQKYRGRSDQLGDHRHLGVADGKVNQRTGWKRQQRLGRLALGFGVAVKAVLVDGVANALGEVGLQFHSGHRQAVQEQH